MMEFFLWYLSGYCFFLWYELREWGILRLGDIVLALLIGILGPIVYFIGLFVYGKFPDVVLYRESNR